MPLGEKSLFLLTLRFTIQVVKLFYLTWNCFTLAVFLLLKKEENFFFVSLNNLMSLFLNFELKTSIFKPVPHWLKKNSQPQQSALSIWKLKVRKQPFTIHFHIKAFWIAVVFHTTKLLLFRSGHCRFPLSSQLALHVVGRTKKSSTFWLHDESDKWRKKKVFFATPSAMTKRSKLFLLFFCRLEHFSCQF